MENFDNLTSHIEDGSIRIVNMIAIPRSISTALGRALNEVEEDSIFINEPFNRHNQSLDVAAKKINEVVEPTLRKKDNTLIVFMKNMASYIGVSEFESLDHISMGTVWSVREPLIQIASLITRMANDIVIENGATKITQDNIEPYIELVTEDLKNSTISNNFSRTGWQSIERQFTEIRTGSIWHVVDGGELIVDPSTVLSGLCNNIGLTFNSRMSSSWTQNYVNLNTGTSRYDTHENAWTMDAGNSNGIVRNSRPPIDLSILPSSLYDHVINTALPTYEYINQHQQD